MINVSRQLRNAPVLAAALICTSFQSPASASGDPIGVGDRYNANHRSEGLVLDGWVVRASAGLRGGYDENITLSSIAPASSSELALRGRLDGTFEAGIYKLDLNSSLSQTWFPDSRENDVTEGGARAVFIAEMRPGFAIRSSIGFDQAVQAGRNSGIVLDGVFEPYTTRAVYRQTPMDAAIEYDIAAIKLSAKAAATAVTVDPLTTRSGVEIDQGFRSGWAYDFLLHSGYGSSPQLELFGEASAAFMRADERRGDSDTWRFVAGGRFELSRLLLSEIRIGVAQQSFPDRGETTGFVYDARFDWFPHELLSMVFEVRRDLDSDIERQAGISVAVPVARDRYKVRVEVEPEYDLLFFAEASYSRVGRSEQDRSEDILALETGVAYAWTRTMRIEANYEYLKGTSNFSGNFDRSRVALGVTAVY